MDLLSHQWAMRTRSSADSQLAQRCSHEKNPSAGGRGREKAGGETETGSTRLETTGPEDAGPEDTQPQDIQPLDTSSRALSRSRTSKRYRLFTVSM